MREEPRLLESLSSILRKPERRIIGLMSGTSMDGVDAALVRFSGGGIATQAVLEGFLCRPYAAPLRQQLLQAASGTPLTAVEHGQLDFAVAHAFAETALALVASADLQPRDVDLIGSHGQTLGHHAPGGEHAAAAATWQAGSAGVLAARTGIAVIADFRVADLALGGTGAPLVPYADYLLRRSADESRMVLNLGGIANFTYLRARCRREEVLGWDVGPGNMILDALAQRLLGCAFDAGGAVAGEGRADRDWVETLLAEEFFQRRAPKSAGREEFGAAVVERLMREGRSRGWGTADLLATAVELTAQAVLLARRQQPLAEEPLDAVYVCGGGRRNETLMSRLRQLLSPARVEGIEALGFDAEAKEAMDFAVLAHESLLGHAGNLPRITGAHRACILGTLALASFPPTEDA